MAAENKASDRGGMLAVVTETSPYQMRKAVEDIAYCFRREFGYDFVPYNYKDTGFTAFLWGRESSTVMDGNAEYVPAVGACLFSPVKHGSMNVPMLHWIWFHPYERRRGHLSAAWPYFESKFGKFLVDIPHSEAMSEFLTNKTKYDEWIEYYKELVIKHDLYISN